MRNRSALSQSFAGCIVLILITLEISTPALLLQNSSALSVPTSTHMNPLRMHLPLGVVWIMVAVAALGDPFLTCVSGFSPVASTTRTTSSTHLFTGAWLEEPRDKKKSSSSSTSEADPRDVDPKANFQQWIQKWEVDHRRFTTGNLLVSGNRLIDQFMGEGKESYADPEILYMLMEEQYNFKFDKIYICAYDMDDAKKRLISRKARYTGLLDKLEFIETDFPWDPEHPEVFNIPTAEQVKQYGITNWILLQDYDHEWMTRKAFEVAKESNGQLKNVVMTMMDYYLDEDTTIPLINSTWDSLGGPRHRKWLEPDLSDPERYQKGDVQFTFLACGCPTDEPEGGADWVYDDLLISSDEDLRRAKEGGYDFIDGETLKKMGYKGAFLAENWDRISQHQMMRFTVDALDLACFSGRAISFKDMWDPISKRVQKPMKTVITGMRSAGFTTVEIMDHIFDKFIDLVRACFKYDVNFEKMQAQAVVQFISHPEDFILSHFLSPSNTNGMFVVGRKRVADVLGRCARIGGRIQPFRSKYKSEKPNVRGPRVEQAPKMTMLLPKLSFL